MSKKTTLLKSEGSPTIEVAMPIDQVLEAIRQYQNDKAFNNAIDQYYNKSTFST